MKLTRKLVLAKAKASDLDSVKKLNCWGCKLTDISIFSQIPNIEVLTLSVNSIASLSPLAGCLSLCELYLRRNLIPSLAELSHLRPLTRLRVLWLAENPCCGTDPRHYRLTVLRSLPRLQKLDNQAQNQPSTNGQTDVETENDSLNYSMEETNKIREQLGMKLLPRDKFPSLSSPSTRETRPLARKTHTLEAVLLLLKDLDEEELHIVHTATQNKLRTYTFSCETLSHTLLTERTTNMEH
ncbi:cilia and flagella associated protein 410 isoform X2 [Osmerus mordax]|uniref:cilia and flagella associated protein 410 isoform X2 n=1 Tax=Osmerus mordax TaxID=8014 RepID=UPI00350F02A9